MLPPESKLFIRDGRTSQEYEIPIVNNTVDAREFRSIRGVVTKTNTKAGGGLQVFDAGLENTAVKKSEISSRDEATGLPCYRGYNVRQLWDCEYEELFHLAIWGHMPSASEKASLRTELNKVMQDVPERVVGVIRRFPAASLPMPMVLAGMSAWLSTEYNLVSAVRGSLIYQGNEQLADRALIKAAGAYAAVLALVACHKRGLDFTPAEQGQPFCENLFKMMGVTNADPVLLDCFRRLTILNADNGVTQSTLAMLVAGSAGGDPMSCLISAISAAYGPLHYGAQETIIQNLKEIGHPDNIAAFLEQIKQRRRRLFGYGHRVTIKDARLAPIMEMLDELNVNSNTHPGMRLAQEIERRASKDTYFQERHLSANADFYVAFLFQGMGFEDDMITVANMAQRMIGLLAHWKESAMQDVKLFRPLHVYTGPDRGRSEVREKARL